MVVLQCSIRSRYYFGASFQPSPAISRTFRSFYTSYVSLNGKKEADESSATGPQWRSREKTWRPTISDVESISWGKPAKKKGTGSRNVPHRLEHEYERFAFDQGRKKGYVEVLGSGWRGERRDSPLMNTFRSLCDAKGQACISLHKSSTGTDDEVVIDLSPLRMPEDFERIKMELMECIESDLGDRISDEYDVESDDTEIWSTQPIYKLPPLSVSWTLSRTDAKALCKRVAEMFQTMDSKASKSRKPKYKKHGKSRRSGGYGIG